MQGYIKCYFPNCSNPVIGQCSGYNRACGKYHCEIHTDGTYCRECARNMEQEILTRRIFDDYLYTAKSFRRKATFKPLLKGMIKYFAIFVIIIIILGFLLIVFGSSTSESTKNIMVLGWAMSECIVMAAFMVFAIIWSTRTANRLVKQKLVEVEIDKPGFTEFYRAWEKERNQAIFSLGMKIAGGIVVSTFGAMIDDAIERNRIKRAVDDALTKHGL